MQTHVKVVGALFVVFGIFGVIGAAFSSVLFGVLVNLLRSSGEDNAVAGGTLVGLAGTLVAVVLLVLAIPQIVCGWGLLTTRSWARVFGIVLAAINLIELPPFGTIFGVYALWVLFNKDTERLLAPAPPRLG